MQSGLDRQKSHKDKEKKVEKALLIYNQQRSFSMIENANIGNFEC